MPDISNSTIMVQSELSGAGAHINGVAQGLADELNRLIAQLQPIADGGWTGGASEYYQGLQWEWNYAAEGLFGPDGVLGEIAQAMHVNWNNYAEAEWANVNTWKQS
ncbi:WXG100 family type VII secretion target [Streptomyces sp. NPDC048527]|uniref:WXG100 family type VII secretion target n=1 Tax=Streptomyces sp. NPDC048527 TaxID=3365568 RepID=UPI00371731D0